MSDIVELYTQKHLTINQIAHMHKVDPTTIYNWLKKHNIPIIRRPDIHKPSKAVLLNEYETKTISMRELAQKYKVGEKTIKRWFKEYQIKPIRSVERKYYHLRKIPFTAQQKEFIIGSLLGDGHIDRSRTKRFVVNHSDKQLEYLEYKKSVLHNYVNKIRKNRAQANRKSTAYNLTTIAHQDFNFFHKLFYNNTKKVIRDDLVHYLTPYVLAIWYMDDGHTRKYNMKLCTEGFTQEENELLRKMIYLKFDLKCKVCEYNNRNKKYYYLSFNKPNSVLLSQIIEPYIIPTMEYKLLRSPTTDTLSPKRDDTV